MIEMNKKGQEFIAVVTIFLVVVGLIIGITGFDTVEANQIAVKTKFGKPVGEMKPGMEFTGMFVDIETYSTLTRKMSVELSGDNYAPSATQQRIFAKVALNYKLNPKEGTVTNTSNTITAKENKP